MARRSWAFLVIASQLLFTSCGHRDLQGSTMLVGIWQGSVQGTQENVSLSFFVSGGGKGRSSTAMAPFDFAWERAGDAVRLSLDLPGFGHRQYVGQMLDDGSLCLRWVDDPHKRVLVLRRSGHSEFTRELIQKYFAR